MKKKIKKLTEQEKFEEFYDNVTSAQDEFGRVPSRKQAWEMYYHSDELILVGQPF